MKLRPFIVVLVTIICVVACDDSTGTIGITPTTDIISSDTASFAFTTRSVILDSVVSNSATCYLGRVFDYETKTYVESNFLAQFSCLENLILAEDTAFLRRYAVADSCDIMLYYDSYYGEIDNPMKLYVYPVDENKIISEDSTYYSNIDLTQYVDMSKAPLATKVFSVLDYTMSEIQRANNMARVRVVLPRSVAEYLLSVAKQHPEYFKNTWSFIHRVCPGFFFAIRSGFGTMLSLNMSNLNLYLHDTSVTDSIKRVVMQFSATPEVIQSTSFENGGLQNLRFDGVDYTYLKSPAGVATELTFPIDEIFEGHESDSLSKAAVTLTRCNTSYLSEYSENLQDALTYFYLPAPTSVLMVRKSEMQNFFQQRKVADFETTFTSTFSSSFNNYTFSNVARLLSTIYHSKLATMQKKGLSSADYNLQYPDWNKVVVVPVTITTATSSSTGLTAQTSVSNDFSMTSTRLVGGTKPIKMSVIYSKYQ